MNQLTVVGLALVLVVLFGLVLSLPVMLLWNWALVAALPVVQPIGWLQAWGLLVLSGLMFKSTGTSKD